MEHITEIELNSENEISKFNDTLIMAKNHLINLNGDLSFEEFRSVNNQEFHYREKKYSGTLIIEKILLEDVEIGYLEIFRSENFILIYSS